jgi:hypothetical protein
MFIQMLMKKFLLAAFVIGAAAIGSATTAEAQTTGVRGTFTHPHVPTERDRTLDRVTPRTTTREVGAIPRAARGNPAQMVNPRAPQRYYGHPEETVVTDPQNPNRVVGIILFGLRW